ncbi:hypothetical protein MHX57_11655, partial [Corynebacterium sp. ACRPY]|nr:hypothetical protein [Corynebacterium sp. ACRPZ]MCG7295203.1 hypothetical protein [Corynebacterium sp. ACRPY]
MTGKHDRAFARRRGTSVAACALGLSLVVTGVQPVAAPQTASQAAAQVFGRTDAEWSGVRYPLGTTTVKYGETTSLSPNVNRATLYPPTSYKLADGVNPGWGAEVNSETGELSITPDSNAELPETDTINVEFTFKDDSTKVEGAKIRLEPAPVYVDQSDKVFWTGREINPVDIRVNRATYDSGLTIDESTLPPGITPTVRNFGNIKHIFLKGVPTEAGTFEVKTQLVQGGSVVEGANGPLEQTFTITVNDSADLPAPVEEDFVSDPAPVKPGESVDIDIPTENASSVEVTGLPEGLTYDGEKSKITGTPKASGKAKVEIITNDAKVITDTIDIQVEGSGDSTTPETTTAEPTTGATTPTSDKPTSATPTSGWVTTQPEPTSGQDTPEPTTKPSTPGSSEPSTSKPTSATPTSGKPTSTANPTSTTKPTAGQPTSGQGTSAQPTTSAPKPTTPTSDKPTPGQPTSGQATPEPTTKPSTPGSSEPSTSKPTSATPTSGKPTSTANPTSTT